MFYAPYLGLVHFNGSIYLLSDFGFAKRLEACTRVLPRLQKQTYTVQLNKIINVQNHKYTTDRYTTTVNIKYTDHIR